MANLNKPNSIPLPIDPLLSEIVETVRQGQQTILTATPGAGKTTRLPAHLLNAVPGKIAVLQPRRMAAVAACQRVCDENGWRVGEQAGYQVRFDSKVTDQTRLIFMTDALMLRRLLSDPELKEFDLIVIDEFHERNLNQDLLLGAILELQQLGRDLKLLVMSATLDLGELEKLLPASQHIDVPGKVFPLEIRHSQKPLSQKTDFDFFERVASAILQGSRETQGDILVFLPGTGEIKRTQDILEQKAFSKTAQRDVFALHGSLPLAEQQQILKPHHKPRVILATNVAEASVTVPGVDYVIDTGLAKVLKMNLNSGFSVLELSRIALFNAKQRAGRAAREKNGVAVRLWTPHEELTQPESLPAECERVDLSSALLLLSHLGVTDFSNFTWLSHPPRMLLNRSQSYLRTIGALDSQNRLAPAGQALLHFPLEPRWGALLLKAHELGAGAIAADAAAIMQDANYSSSQEVHAHTECDLLFQIQQLHDSKDRRLQAIKDSADQLRQLLKKMGSVSPSQKDPEELLQEALLITQPDRIGRRRQTSERGVLVGGRGVKIGKESQVRESEFFVALKGIDHPGQADTTLTMASGFSKQRVLESLKEQISVQEEVSFAETKGQFFTKRVRKFKDLEIDEPTLTPLHAKDLGDRLIDILVSRWDWVVEQNLELQHWLSRWNFLVNKSGNNESSPFHALPSEKIRELVEMAALGKTKIEEIVQQDFVSLLPNILDAGALRTLKTEAPSHFLAPSGVAHKIMYEPNLDPYVEVRLQEMFGTTATPKLGFGTTPLTFRLLAPNFRPVQTTSDIEGFWQRAYIEVKKELKSRYPKHSWPDDPLKAQAVAKGRRR